MTSPYQPTTAAVRTKRGVMVLWCAVAGLVLHVASAHAAGKTKRKPEAKPSGATTSESSSTQDSSTAETQSTSGHEDARVDGKKAKVLTFGALDVEGKMRTPQLLFFLNRVKAELDSTTPLRRSFMNELNATAKEKGL